MILQREDCLSMADRNTDSPTDYEFDKKSIGSNATETLTPPLTPLSHAEPPCDELPPDSSFLWTGREPKKAIVRPDAKPFFIMDWLDQVNEQDLELAQKMLRTPQKKELEYSKKLALPSSVPARTHPEQRPALSTPPRKQSRPPQPQSCFRQRSIAIGNGWNARGLQKARHGLWNEALGCWENALEIRVQVLGDSHVDVANTCNNMGIALGKLGRAQEALSALKRALDIRSRHHGLRSAEVAATLHNMGNVLQQAGNLEAAVECFCETKKIQEHVFGPTDVQVARACVAMGHTYFQATEYADAREAYGDALAIFQSVGLNEANLEMQNVMADIQELDKLVDQCSK
jgi:tetratricopeptide (TPR) repeat protein